MKNAYIVKLSNIYHGSDAFVLVYAPSETELLKEYCEDLELLAYDNLASYCRDESDLDNPENYFFYVVKELNNEDSITEAKDEYNFVDILGEC